MADKEAPKRKLSSVKEDDDVVEVKKDEKPKATTKPVDGHDGLYTVLVPFEAVCVVEHSDSANKGKVVRPGTKKTFGVGDTFIDKYYRRIERGV